MAHAPRKLVLRIKSGRLVSPEPLVTAPASPMGPGRVAVTVSDVRSMASRKLSSTVSLHKALLLQTALQQIDVQDGHERFCDPQMDPPPAWMNFKTRQRAALQWPPHSSCVVIGLGDNMEEASKRKRPAPDPYASDRPNKMLKVDTQAPSACVPMRSPTQARDVAFLMYQQQHC
jgi:hypothetical protein